MPKSLWKWTGSSFVISVRSPVGARRAVVASGLHMAGGAEWVRTVEVEIAVQRK